jgi:hypothetical protein
VFCRSSAEDSLAVRCLFSCLLALHVTGWSSASFATQSVVGQPGCAALPTALRIDEVWGGTRIRFSAVETQNAVYVAYYNVDRWLTVAEVNKCTGHIATVQLPSQFAGWDAHNHIMSILDGQGRLHLAGNMHVTSLIYARMSQPGDLKSLRILRPMTGQAEDRTTYPSFFRFPDGALGFSYRYGKSGDGEEIINRFDGEDWHRWLDSPLMAPAPGDAKVNAYRTDYATGPDGMFHVAWVWRKNKVETNFHVNYARSKDLKHWQDSRGNGLALPMTPANSEVVDPVPVGSGLFNNIQIGFDGRGQPVISYLKFDAQGASQLWHARLEAGVWRVRQSTQWNYRWDPRGGGVIPPVISFGGVHWRNEMLIEQVRHPELGSTTLRFDVDTLGVVGTIPGYAWNKLPPIKRQSPAGTIVSFALVQGGPASPASGYAISWASMPADTRDSPRLCKREVADCRYAFDLFLHPPPR